MKLPSIVVLLSEAKGAYLAQSGARGLEAAGFNVTT
jgi:hypothetical protein